MDENNVGAVTAGESRASREMKITSVAVTLRTALTANALATAPARRSMTSDVAVDLDDVGVPVPRDDDDDAIAARAPSSPASASKRPRSRDGDASSTLCAFFLRGRCASCDACLSAHVSPSSTHAMNCGCARCRPRRPGDDDDETVRNLSRSEDQRRPPSAPAVAAREANERLERRDEIIAECAVISNATAVTFWREFLRRAATEEGEQIDAQSPDPMASSSFHPTFRQNERM